MSQELLHCARCDTYKSQGKFYKHKGRPGGRAAYCAECERAVPSRHPTGKGQTKGLTGRKGPTGPRKPRKPLEVISVGMLRCGKCKKIKLTDNFHKHSSSKRGFAYECKSCRYVKPLPKVRETDETGNFRCLKCNTFKSQGSFYTSSNYRNSGRNSKCKTCILGHEPKPKRFKSNNEAECLKCKTIKSLHMFRKQNGFINGKCKPCQYEIERLRRKLKRANRPHRVLVGRYNKYKRDAKERDLAFEITAEQFDVLIRLPCSYCGSTDKIGVDRANNSLGYLASNCVPCCGPCNFIKRTMSVNKLKLHLAKMVKHMDIKL